MLKGKVAIVTGGSRGIGRSIALALAEEGCDIAICARGEEQLRKTEAEIREAGVRVYTAPTDVNDAAAIDSLACEGALLADEIANTASTPQFSRVHAGELRTKASNFEDALSERPTLPEIEREVRALADKAGRIAGLLGELEAHPSNSAVADRLRPALERQGGCA